MRHNIQNVNVSLRNLVSSSLLCSMLGLGWCSDAQLSPRLFL